MNLRPTIFIFTDDLGYQSDNEGSVTSNSDIYSQLCFQLAGLDKNIFPIIGIINAKNTANAKILPIQYLGKKYFPKLYDNLNQNNSDQVDNEEDYENNSNISFTVAFDTVFQSILNAGVLQEINRGQLDKSEYTVPQIFIIGDISGSLHQIFDLIIAYIISKRYYNLLPAIYYVAVDSHFTSELPNITNDKQEDLNKELDDSPNGDPKQNIEFTGTQKYNWFQDLMRLNQQVYVSFCFLIQDLKGHNGKYAIYTQYNLVYLLGEILFSFTTPCFTQNEYLSQLISNGNIQSNYDIRQKIGSIATSSIRFPLGESSSYCALLLTADILAEMAKGTSFAIDFQKRSEYAQKAKDRVETILENIRPTVDRPFAPGYLWQPLQILQEHEKRRPRDIRLQERMEGKLEELLRIYSDEENNDINEGYLKDKATRAQILLKEFHRNAERAWLRAKLFLQGDTIQFIDKLWIKGDIDLADAFVDQLAEQLIAAETELEKIRKEHFDEKILLIDHMSSRAGRQGDPWYKEYVQENNPGGYAQPGFNGQARQENQNEPNDLPMHEQPNEPIQNNTELLQQQNILNNLYSKMRWLKSRKPKALQYLGLALSTSPLLMVLLMIAGGSSLFLMLLGAVLAGGVLSATIFTTNKFHFRRIRKSEKNILAFYRGITIAKCEEWEDRLRMNIIWPLRHTIELIKDQIENLEERLKHMQNTVSKDAATINNQLFDTQFVQDVLVAKGDQLLPVQRTLKWVYEYIEKLRHAEPKVDFHQNIARIGTAFREKIFDEITNSPGMNAEYNSYLTLPDSEFISKLTEFSSQINTPYFTDELMNIQSALTGSLGEQFIQQTLQNSETLFQASPKPASYQYAAVEKLTFSQYLQLLQQYFEINQVFQSRFNMWFLTLKFTPGGGVLNSLDTKPEDSDNHSDPNYDPEQDWDSNF